MIEEVIKMFFSFVDSKSRCCDLCPAILRVKRKDLPLAYYLMASKRLQLDEVVS